MEWEATQICTMEKVNGMLSPYNGLVFFEWTLALKRLLFCFVDLDKSEKNENLKFSIVVRLPEAVCEKAYQLWDHPVSSNFFATNYVKRLLEKRWTKEVQ
ncbi:hypothetical protein NDU88_003420 [Pleurodeles waltl]|uniref:Uncharacterized protein n=1 Tax=Pleurodeles waltl TaxID=8319 RepID=A0AAV7SFS6_PLEWA|nr:hypothetical protein NDU88_003420 [Pleurodeles waltl]